MKHPVLGSNERGASVRFDLGKLIAWRLFITASSGGGKSYTLRALLEATEGLVQRVVIDVDGDYVTLREKCDFIVVGGEDADYPVSVAGVPTLIRAIVETNASFIIDISGLPATEHKRTAGENRFAFVGAFMEALIALPRKDWRAMVVAVDEAHLFAPQGGKPPSSLYGMQRFGSEARKRGFCPWYATQRISKIDKDSIADLRNRMLGLVTEGVDQDRAADEWGLRKEEKQALEDLKPGTFWCKGPWVGGKQRLLTIRRALTTHPEPGRPMPPVPAPSAHVKKLLTALKAIPKRVKAEAEEKAAAVRTVAELRAEIAHLKKELEMATKKVQVEVEVEERQVFRKGEIEKLHKAVEKLDRFVRMRQALMESDSKALSTAITELQRIQAQLGASRPAAGQVFRTIQPPASQRRMPKLKPAKEPPIDGSVKIEARHEKVAMALGFYHPEVLPMETLAALSDYSSSSRSYLDILRALRAAGLIFYENGTTWLTDQGALRFVPTDQPASTWGFDHHAQHWSPHLESRFRKVLDCVPFDGTLTMEELAKLSDYSPESRSYLDILRFLRHVGLIHYTNKSISLTGFYKRADATPRARSAS